MNTTYSIKNSFILVLSFVTLSACSVVNKRGVMDPVESDGWEIKSSPSTLSGWTAIDISTSNNNYYQASYRCDSYKLYLNSIPELSYSGIGALIPTFPAYYKSNNKMSIFLNSNKNESLIVKSLSDCPDIYSLSPSIQQVETVSGENNLCQYQFKNDELGRDSLTLSIKDKLNNCEIDDIDFVKNSNWTYCPFCFLNLATQPVHNYTAQDHESNSVIKESSVNINSNATKLSTVFAGTAGYFIGAVTGGYIAVSLSNCSDDPNKECFYDFLGGVAIGSIVGMYIGAEVIDQNTGVIVNLIYPY